MKHKWLEEAGIHDYPDNNWGGVFSGSMLSLKALKFTLRSKIEKRNTGVDPRDCWSLDASFYRWLYEHLCQLLKDTNADLTCQKFQHNGKEYTEEEYIKYLKKLLINIINFDEFKECPELPPNKLEKNEDGTITSICTATEEQLEEFRKIYNKNFSEYEKLRREIFDVFYELLPTLWW